MLTKIIPSSAFAIVVAVAASFSMIGIADADGTPSARKLSLSDTMFKSVMRMANGLIDRGISISSFQDFTVKAVKAGSGLSIELRGAASEMLASETVIGATLKDGSDVDISEVSGSNLEALILASRSVGPTFYGPSVKLSGVSVYTPDSAASVRWVGFSLDKPAIEYSGNTVAFHCENTTALVVNLATKSVTPTKPVC